MIRPALVLILVCAAPAPADDQDATTKTLVEHLSKQLKDRSAAKRVEAAKELAQLGEKAKPAARALCAACLDSSGKVSMAAADALAKVRPDLHPHVVVLIVEFPSQNHTKALNALSRIGTDAAPVVPVLLGYIRRYTGNGLAQAPAAVDCLSAVAGDDELLLGPFLQFYRVHDLQAAALRALVHLGEAKAETRKRILPTLMAAINDGYRVEAINGLGRFGPHAKDALPVLDKLRFDPAAPVRDAAAAAIAKIQAKP